MNHIGTILDIEDKKTFVFTTDCGVTTIRTKKEYFIGQQITFTEKDIYKNDARKILFRTLASVAALFVVAIIGWMVINQMNAKDTFDSDAVAMVSVDINPSVEFIVNRDRLIISASALNDDGINILEGIDLKGLSMEDGIDTIIAIAGDQGYIKDGKRIILVSAAMCTTETSTAYVQQLKDILDGLRTNQDDTNIMTVFVDDPDIIADAESNGMSIGRAYLYKYAQAKNSELTAEDIRDGALTDLLSSLDAITDDGNIDNHIPENTELETLYAEFDDNLNITKSGDSYELQWAKAPTDQDFQYYELSVLKNDAEVLTQTITDLETTTCIIYDLPEGNKYYVNVNYVCDNFTFSGSVLTLKVLDGTIETTKEPTKEPTTTEEETTLDTTTPETTVTTPETTTTQTPETTTVKETTVLETTTANTYRPKLSVTVSGGSMKFQWTKSGSEQQYNGTNYSGFYYYKVVASKTNPNPVYPDDGYLTYICDNTQNSWTLNPSTDCYNQSPELVPGQTYYFSITYVYDNGKFSSTTVKATIPAAAVVNFVPSFSVSTSDTALIFNWTEAQNSVNYNGTTYSGFRYYKIVASATVKNPTYPQDGYIWYSANLCDTCADICMTDCNYNPDPLLEHGVKYYFSINYVFENGTIVMPGQRITIP